MVVSAYGTRAAKTNELILRYQDTRDLKVREELVEDMQDMARALAGKLNKKFPPHIDYDTILSDCNYGLLQAIESFDRTKGVNFGTHASNRMRGAVFDGINERTPGIRQANELEKKLGEKLSGSYSYEELRALSGYTEVKFRNQMQAVRSQKPYSLSQDIRSQKPHFLSQESPDEGMKWSALLEDKVTDILERLQIKEQVDLLRKKLSSKYRTLLEMKHVLNLTFREMGKKMGFSPSRAEQIYKQAKTSAREILLLYAA